MAIAPASHTYFLLLSFISLEQLIMAKRDKIPRTKIIKCAALPSHSHMRKKKEGETGVYKKNCCLVSLSLGSAKVKCDPQCVRECVRSFKS